MSSGDVLFAFTSPYGTPAPTVAAKQAAAESACPNPGLVPDAMRAFVTKHGMSVYAVGVQGAG